MNEKSIDLHMHSHFSDDGEFSPERLARQCAEAGVKVMAISDHNCARANEEGRRAARAAGIAYISAIEIDCVFQGVNLHLLGYGIDDQSADFAEIEQHVRRQGGAASEEMLSKTRKLGFDIAREDMEKAAGDGIWKESWTGELFAEVLLEKSEYREHPLLLPYRAGGERSDNPLVNFYWDYYAQGKPCYAHIDYPSLARAIEIVRGNGGRAVLAHPGVNLKGRGELLEAIARAGLDGVEAFSSYHTPEQAAYFYDAAQKLGLFVTCGSDYHGKTKPAISLGGHGSSLGYDLMLDQLGDLTQEK